MSSTESDNVGENDHNSDYYVFWLHQGPEELLELSSMLDNVSGGRIEVLNDEASSYISGRIDEYDVIVAKPGQYQDLRKAIEDIQEEFSSSRLWLWLGVGINGKLPFSTRNIGLRRGAFKIEGESLFRFASL